MFGNLRGQLYGIMERDGEVLRKLLDRMHYTSDCLCGYFSSFWFNLNVSSIWGLINFKICYTVAKYSSESTSIASESLSVDFNSLSFSICCRFNFSCSLSRIILTSSCRYPNFEAMCRGALSIIFTKSFVFVLLTQFISLPNYLLWNKQYNILGWQRMLRKFP